MIKGNLTKTLRKQNTRSKLFFYEKQHFRSYAFIAVATLFASF